MNYPNKAKKEYNKYTSYANRGMDLEDLLNQSNDYYLKENIAVIYKKPTPITISEVKYGNNERVITKAYFRTPSTLDYNGIYKGKYIDFDAKETLNKTAFPIQNVHAHQLKHMQNVINHGGISFLIIYINNEFYFLDGNIILSFIEENTRKSIPYTFIKEKGILIEQKIRPRLDYLKALEKVYFQDLEK